MNGGFIIRKVFSTNGLELNAIMAVYQDAMRSSPWFENLPLDLISERVRNDFSQSHSEQFVVISDKGEIEAAMWWDEISLIALALQRGVDLADYCRQKLSGRIAWFRDLLIKESCQSMGLGGLMVDFAIARWREEGYKNVLLRIHLGGIDNDIPSNIKAMKLYTRKGFQLIEDITKISKDINGNPVLMGFMVITL